VNQLLEYGERVFNLQRLFNLREANLTPKEDMVPPRFLEKNPELSKEVRRYYRARKWDQNGVPKEDILKQLGLA
jgi:aldehyde:ferredoxin oxidoreductase